MMRNIPAMMVMAVPAIVASGASLALEATDTIAAWQRASAEEKAQVVGKLLQQGGAGGSKANVIACLDSASGVAGHADLRIVEVAKACRANGDDPV